MNSSIRNAIVAFTYFGWILILVWLVTKQAKQYETRRMMMIQELRVKRHNNSNKHTLPPKLEGYDSSRNCHYTIPDYQRGVVCPHQEYMGLTNILLNIIRCIHLAMDMCHNGTAYIPLRVQHATIHDLFESHVWQLLGSTYNVHIQFYCEDRVMTSQESLTDAEFDRSVFDTTLRIPIVKFLTPCLEGPLFVKDAFSTYYGNRNTTNAMLLKLMEHPSRKVQTYINAIRIPLLKQSKNGFINTIHLRFESDAWMLLTTPQRSAMLQLLGRLNVLDEQIVKAIVNSSSSSNKDRSSSVVWYGTGAPLDYVWSFSNNNTNFHYKREYIEEKEVNTSYATPYWSMANITALATPTPPTPSPTPAPKKGRKILPTPGTKRPPLMIEVTNSTGALIDFVIALFSNRTVTAEFSGFGLQIARLRCLYGLGETWTYKGNLKIRKRCSGSDKARHV